MGKEKISLRIDFLNTFLTVCTLKSFSKAAEKLQKSQGGISQQITQLEEYFSAKLINRTSRDFSLTPEGEVLLKRCQEMLQLVEQTKKDILAKASLLGGVVNICASSTPGEYILPRFIAEFQANNPHVEFNVTIANSGICLKHLQNNEYDLIAVGSLMEIKNTTDLLIHTIADEEIVLICAPSHPLLQKANYNPETSRYRVKSQDLDSYQFIVREKQSGTQREFEKQYGKTLAIGLELNSPQAIITAVQDSKMLGIVSVIVAKKAESAGLINLLEVEDLPSFKRKIYLIRSKQSQVSEVSGRFWDYIVSNPFEIQVDW